MLQKAMVIQPECGVGPRTTSPFGAESLGWLGLAVALPVTPGQDSNLPRDGINALVL